MGLHVSVQCGRYVHSMGAQSCTYEENHREEKASRHKHCKEEKPSCVGGNVGKRSSDMNEPGIE